MLLKGNGKEFFMEENNLNAVNDAQEVNVEPQKEPPKQTKAENSAFAAMRKRENKAVIEKEQLTLQYNQLLSQLKENESKAKEESEELESLREYRRQRVIDDDIALIKKEYPELDLKRDALPEEFIRIMATGAVDALTAAKIILAQREKEAKRPPEDIGPMSNAEFKDKEFYSPAEVDRLTREDFKRDPKLLKRIQKSMTKWR